MSDDNKVGMNQKPHEHHEYPDPRCQLHFNEPFQEMAQSILNLVNSANNLAGKIDQQIRVMYNDNDPSKGLVAQVTDNSKRVNDVEKSQGKLDKKINGLIVAVVSLTLTILAGIVTSYFNAKLISQTTPPAIEVVTSNEAP